MGPSPPAAAVVMVGCAGGLWTEETPWRARQTVPRKNTAFVELVGEKALPAACLRAQWTPPPSPLVPPSALSCSLLAVRASLTPPCSTIRSNFGSCRPRSQSQQASTGACTVAVRGHSRLHNANTGTRASARPADSDGQYVWWSRPSQSTAPGCCRGRVAPGAASQLAAALELVAVLVCFKHCISLTNRLPLQAWLACESSRCRGDAGGRSSRARQPPKPRRLRSGSAGERGEGKGRRVERQHHTIW